MMPALLDDSMELIARGCARLLDEKKATDIVLLDLSAVNSYFCYFLIATGNSAVHCRGLAREVRKFLAAADAPEYGKSPTDDSGWIALDYYELVVHIFTQEMRDYYQLDRLWGDARSIDCDLHEKNLQNTDRRR